MAVLATGLMWGLDYRQYNYLSMTQQQKKVFETTTEYYKMMHIDMPNYHIDEAV